MMERSSRANPG